MGEELRSPSWNESRETVGWLAQLREAVRDGETTDRIIPVWLPFFAFLVFGAVLFFVSSIFFLSMLDVSQVVLETFTYLGLGIIVFLVLLAVAVDYYLIYMGAWRCTRHTERSPRMFKAAVEILKIKGLETGRAEAELRAIGSRRRILGPRAWVAIFIAGAMASYVLSRHLGRLPGYIVNLGLTMYFFHTLTRDFYRHSVWEARVARAIARAVGSLGIPAPRSPGMIPERNTLKYAALTVITLGVFILYWAYVMTSDHNEHFRSHKMYDEHLLRIMESLVSPGSAGHSGY